MNSVVSFEQADFDGIQERVSGLFDLLSQSMPDLICLFLCTGYVHVLEDAMELVLIPLLLLVRRPNAFC